MTFFDTHRGKFPIPPLNFGEKINTSLNSGEKSYAPKLWGKPIPTPVNLVPRAHYKFRLDVDLKMTHIAAGEWPAFFFRKIMRNNIFNH